MDVKSAVYDAEAERLASLNLLYKSFCNNLVLGQWELARACVQQLHRDGKNIGVNIGDILRDVAHYPYGKSTGCKTIPSPHHLSWLCLQAVKDISTSESRDVEKLEKEINFRMLLVEVTEKASASVIKELYQCHQASLWSESLPAPKASSAALSSETQSFLHGILLARADLGHAIIEALMRPELADHRNNELLQGLYVQAVNTLLDALGNGQQGLAPGVSMSGQAARIYELLSMYNPQAYWNYIQLRLLCTRLIKLCSQEQPVLQKERVMSALLGRATPYLIDEFCKVDYELLLQSVPGCRSGSLGEMLEDQRLALHFLSEPDPELRWRHLFQLSSSKQCHVLELILDTALALVRGERWEELDKLLKSRELQPLRPLVLLLGWSSCRQPSAARSLLHTLWNEHFPCRHPALVAGCHNLSYQIDLIQWCLDKAKPLIDSAGGWEVRQQQRAVELFQGLGAHSVLFVLHQATRLASLHHQEVLQLLRNTQPRKEDESEKRKKFVRFSTSSTEDSTDEEQGSVLSPQLVNLEQERDIAVFRGYCALKNVMDVICFCADHASLHLMNPVYVKRSLQPRNLSSMFGEELVASSSEEDSGWNGMHSDEATRAAAVSPDEFQKLYDENVSQKLKEARDHLSQLHPLTFRVEVLEDVFSLLFVTHRDVEDWGIQPEGDSPDEEAEKSLGQCNSSDSLVTSILSEEDLTPTRPHQVHTSQQPSASTPISKSQPVASAFSTQPFGGNYDDPYVSPLRVSQSQHDQTTIPENKLAGGDGGHQSEGKAKLRRSLFSTQLKPKSLDYRSSSGPSNHLGDPDVGLTGFLSNEYVTRDVLAVLKDALSDLNCAHFQLQGGKVRTSAEKQKESAPTVDSAVEEALVQFVKSSVSPDELQQRITQLVRRVNEAQWRFQMVAHDSLPKQPGMVLKEPVLISREEFGEVCLTETRQNSRSKACGEKGQGMVPENMDVTAARLDMGSNHHHLRRALLPLNSRPSRGIIPMMLSSPETLLTMNLLKGNFVQAQQVIKLFKMEGQPLAVETCFIEAFIEVASRIHSLDTSGSSVKQPARSKKRSIRALASVAAAGMASAALSNIVEDLLISPYIPPLPVPRAQASVGDTSPPVPGGVTQSLALLLDLLFASCHSWELAHTMLEILKPYIPPMDKEEKADAEFVPTLSDPRPKADKIKGCAKFINQLYNLINLGSESFRGDLEEGRSSNSGVSATITAVTEVVRKGLEHLICSATLPLQSSRMQRLIGVREDIRQVYSKVITVMNESGRLMRSESTESSPAPSPSPSPSSTGSSSKKHRRADEPPLHYAFKHLIAVIERSIPRTGLVQLLKEPGNREHAAGRNYLLSLYEHLRELAYLVAESEAKTKETVVVPRNYFSMLSEGPILTLGRLIFGTKMHPSRLEKVALKLSLNLNHIIVHSCCPRIPAKHFRLPTFKVCSAELEVRGARIVANSGPCEGPKTTDPNLLVQNILTRLLRLMKDSASLSNARSIFDVAGARMLVRKAEWQEVVAMTRELQEVDLELLETDKQRQCFYTNLTNLMTVHMHLLYIQRHQVSSEGSGDEEGEYAVPMPEVPECISVMSTDSFFHQSLFAYRVGQLGVVSLFDLRYIVCRQGLLPPTMWGDFLTHRMHSLHPADPWLKYGPPTDTRLLFALADGSLHSPPLQVLTVDMLNMQLQNCMQAYVNITTEINTDSQEVLIGELLVWYRQDFVSEQQDTMDARLFGLVNFLAIHLHPEKIQALQVLGDFDLKHTNLENIDMTGRRELPYKIRIQPLSNDFGFLFDYETLGKCLAFPHRQFGRSMSLPHSMEASTESVLDRSGSAVEAPTYLLTPQTLEYIKSDSLLVATLVSLVCADELDDIEQHYTDDHFTMGEPFKPRTMSDISLVDIRSYRYQRLTEDFPILQRHLVNYIIPLAGADNPEIFQGSDPVLKFVTNEIEEKVKLCMFSLHSSSQFQGVVHSMLNAFFRERRWGSALSVLRSVPETTMADRGELQASYDFILTCWVLEEAENGRMDQPAHGHRLLSLASSFWSAEAGARLALAVCEKLPAHAALQLLELSLARVSEPGLKAAVEKQLGQVKLFCKISEMVHSLQIKLSIQAADSFVGGRRSSQYQASTLADFTDWRDVVAISRTEPQRVLEVLLQLEDFATTREWAQLHSLDEALMLEIEESHIQSLLNQQNTMKAFQVLEELRKSKEEACLAVCDGLVQKLRNHREVQFVTSYMLTQLTVATPEEREKLQLQHIGAKALMCLPATIREEYAQLISCPHLILEQLIMNMQADLAGQVFHKIRNDFSMLRDARHAYTWEQFNSLLTLYATKALEVVVVQSLLDPRFERSSTSSSGGSYRPDESEISGRLSAETHRVRRLALESSYLTKGAGETSPQASPQTSAAVPVLSGSPKLRSGSQGERPVRKFVMPAQPPPPEQWVPDSSAAVCMVCNIERFSMFNRRHHCRRCGRVVCAACSSHRASVLGVSSRICDECYEQIFLTSSETRQKQEQEIYSQRVRESLSGASPSAQQSSLPTTSAPQPHRHAPHNLQAAIAHTTHQWRLHHDETHNSFVREEFYYEQAPSVSLCMSLLKLHSNAKECGVLILKLCDDLSKFLQPVAPGIPNPEVDYILIISMMKQLLFQAKIKFLTSNDNFNLTNCEMYMNRVDLLKTLVVANYTDLPSLQELTKLDYVRRLRDKLVANERLELALEVSARCGLKDVDGVWAAWGRLCLQCGDYAGARDKYSHCLKTPADKNKPSAASRWLSEIVHFLSTEPLTGSREIELLLNNPGGLYEHLINFQKTPQQRFELDGVKGRECQFYLSTYGSHLDYIKFLRQHGYWTKLFKHLKQEQCQGDVFLEGVLQPALVEGELTRLLDNMAMADPTLQSWELYLAAACRYLLKHRHFHLLHHFQVFMKDFLRAAMTCVQHFYQQGAQSYLDLAHRLNFLDQACQHLSAYWDRTKYGSVPMPGEGPSPQGKTPVSWNRSGQGKEAVRMTMTKAEVDRYERLIQLQREVTRYLKDCLTSNQQQAAAVASSYAGMAQASRLPTLFGENRARQEVINMVLMSGKIQTGFQLANTIMKDCHMDMASTLTHTGRQLAEQLRLGDIQTLLESLGKAGVDDDNLVDRILGECILVLIKSQVESKEMESMIKLFRQDANKINAYILCRKLKSAYLLAVKSGRVEDVQRIAGVAQREGQTQVKSICDRWLQQHNKPK